MNVWTATTPSTVRETVNWTALLPPYRVILHNDEHNSMEGVVAGLIKSVPLSTEEAIAIMMEAHNSGRALVIVCPLELAELYQERLESFGLTSTIESDR